MTNEAVDDCKACQPCSIMWDMRPKVGEWNPKCPDTGPCRVAGVIGTRPVQPPVTFDLSLRLGPWESDVADPTPQLAGECGGTWVASGEKKGPVGQGPIFTLDLAPAAEPAVPSSTPSSPRVKVVPSASKKLFLSFRDNQSLIDEILEVKRSVKDTQELLRKDKIQASIVEMENRKMARDIEEMEKPNCQSISVKPQVTVRLRAKIRVCKTKIKPQEAKEEAQSDEIHQLRIDARASHTREVEFERDIFASEIDRLTALVKRLKQFCNYAASLENRDEIEDMTEDAEKLEERSKELEEKQEGLTKDLAKANYHLNFRRSKAGEEMMEARNAEKRCRDLERKNIKMSAQIERIKKKNRDLAKELKNIEWAFRKAKGSFF